MSSTRTAAYGALAAAVAVGGGVVLGSARVSPLSEAILAACAVGIAAILGGMAGRGAQNLRRQLAYEHEGSLRVRRELYRLKRNHTKSPTVVREARSSDTSGVPSSSLSGFAEAVKTIASCLNEKRLRQSVAREVRRSVGEGSVSFYVHDRKTDRWIFESQDPDVGGDPGLDMTQGLLREALRQRSTLSRHADAELFNAADDDVLVVAPVFNRELAAGALVVRGPVECSEGVHEKVDVMASIAGLALSVSRLSTPMTRESYEPVDQGTPEVLGEAITDA